MSKPYLKRTDTEWADVIRACKSSGLSDHQWCEENGISQSSFYRNLRKFRRTTVGSLPEASPDGTPAAPAAQEVIPVRILEDAPALRSMPESGGSPAARLFCNGISIELYNGADAGFLSGILRAAATVC